MRRRRGDRVGRQPELMIAGDEAWRCFPAGFVKALQDENQKSPGRILPSWGGHSEPGWGP